MSLVLELIKGFFGGGEVHRKVRVPQVVGTIITVVLAVLAAVGGSVPEAAPYVAAAVTVLQFVSGYLTYA